MPGSARIGQGAVAFLYPRGCACGGSAPSSSAINGDEQFVSVNAATNSAAASAPAADNSSFYLAINKSELGKKYFFSAYLTQYFPGAVSYGAARSLGTRVVTFKVQNGKLFVFDAASGKKDSNTFDPSLIVDAYPIVNGALTGNGSQNFVVFDPSQGMNQFGLLADAFAGGTAPAKFNISLSYLQRYRKLSDGVTFEQVFTGYSDQGDPNSWEGGENNAFRGSGTLGIALRKYSEGAGFTPAPVYDAPWFFTGDLHLVPNSGTVTACCKLPSRRPPIPMATTTPTTSSGTRTRRSARPLPTGATIPTRARSAAPPST